MLGRDEQLRIVLADDDPLYRGRIARRLADHTGAEIVVARNASEVLAVVRENADVDIVLLNVFMPQGDNPELVDRDGLGPVVEAARHIKSEFPSLRIFGCSVDAGVEQQEWFNTHTHGFIEKEALRPFHFPQTLELLTRSVAYISLDSTNQESVNREVDGNSLGRGTTVGGTIGASISHSEDFRSVSWFGETFTFTTKQAAILAALWAAQENGTPELSQEYLLDCAGSAGTRLRDLFRAHVAWQTIIVSGSKKGTYRLNGSSSK